jgi:hypothetical protein
MRSSILASISGRVERPFSDELGSAYIGEPSYQTAIFLEISIEMRIVGLAEATKHTLSSLTFFPMVA